MRKVTVTVTQQDIEEGERENPCCCPIALALNRVIGWPIHEQRVHVDKNDVRFFTSLKSPQMPLEDHEVPEWCDVDLPPAARWFIEVFDRSLGGEIPFTFELEVPECV